MYADITATSQVAAEPPAVLIHARDGRPVWIRPSDPNDGPAVSRFNHYLSSITVQRRFLAPLPQPMREQFWRRALEQAVSEPGKPLMLLALAGPGLHEVVGIGEMVPEAGSFATSEFALVIRDDYQRRGIGLMLCRHLARIAADWGVSTLAAVVEAENYPMLQLLRRFSPTFESSTSDGVAQIRIDLSTLHG